MNENASLCLPDCACLHEGEAALHEEDNDGHDEQEEVVHVLGLVLVDVVTVGGRDLFGHDLFGRVVDGRHENGAIVERLDEPLNEPPKSRTSIHIKA